MAVRHLILHIHVGVNWQLSKQGSHWTISWLFHWLRCRPIKGTCWSFPLISYINFTSFQLITGSTPSKFPCNGYTFFLFEVKKLLTGALPLALAKIIILRAIWYYAMVRFRTFDLKSHLIAQVEENCIILKKMLNSSKVNKQF